MATYLCSLAVFFLPGTHFMQVTTAPCDTYKSNFHYLSFTSPAPLEDNRMEAVISAVWPFAFIAAY